MSATSSFRPLWARFAAWLGLVAVFTALIAPVSTLAEDVRTGQLGGLCSATGGGQAGSDDSSPSNGHCALCGSAGLGMPPLDRASGCHAVVAEMAVVFFEDSTRPASVPGLPFSRGPPAL